ncbi:hypothetical protein V8F06_014195 [Rhypophila decipiens]
MSFHVFTTLGSKTVMVGVAIMVQGLNCQEFPVRTPPAHGLGVGKAKITAAPAIMHPHYLQRRQVLPELGDSICGYTCKCFGLAGKRFNCLSTQRATRSSTQSVARWEFAPHELESSPHMSHVVNLRMIRTNVCSLLHVSRRPALLVSLRIRGS